MGTNQTASPEEIGRALFAASLTRRGMNPDQYKYEASLWNPKPGESLDAYRSRLSNYMGNGALIDADFGVLNDPKYASGFNALKTPAQLQAEKDKAFGNQVTQQTSDLLNYLSKPVDLNSPFAKQVLMGAQRGSQTSSYNRGLGTGGFADTQAKQAYMGAAMGLEQQRQANLLSALGLGSGRDISLSDLSEKKYEFDAGQAYKNWQAQQQQNMALPAAIGGVAGAAGMGLATGFNPQAMGAGYAGGSSLAGGLAGAMGPQWSAPLRP